MQTNGFRFISTLICLLMINSIMGCGKTQTQVSAKILKINGTVEIKRSMEKVFDAAKEKDTLNRGDLLKTGKGSSATLEIMNRGVVEIRADTAFELDPNPDLIQQTEGEAFYKINKTDNSFKIVTPQGITSVLGTRFMVKVLEESTVVGVEEGRVSFTTISGKERILKAKEQAVIDSRGFVGGITLFDLNSDSFNYIKIDGRWVPKEMNGQK